MNRLSCFSAAVNSDPMAILAPRYGEDVEILDLSIWYNSSSRYRTLYTTFESSIVESPEVVGQLYIFGGYQYGTTNVWRKIQKFDLNQEENRWIELENAEIPAHLGTTHTGFAVYNGGLYVFSGQVSYGCGPATRASAYLNLTTFLWEDLPSIPEARYNPQVIIVNNHVHLFGGVKSDRFSPALDYWVLNLDQLDEGWQKRPSLSESGAHGHRALIDDYIYFFSFEHGHSPVQLSHTDVWDKKRVSCPDKYFAQPAVFKMGLKSTFLSPQWEKLSDIPHPVSHASSMVLNDRLIMLVGGIGPEGDRYVKHVQLFDSRINLWRSLSPLPVTARSPLLWLNQEESVLHLQTCSSDATCHNIQAYIIWSHKAISKRCLFHTHLDCRTRELQRSPYERYRRISDFRWNSLFSQRYLISAPTDIERLRRTWNELQNVELTSITLFERLQANNIENSSASISQENLSPFKMNAWITKTATEKSSHEVRAIILTKLVLMNLWSKGSDESPNQRPILLLEDDADFLQSKDETLNVLEKTLTFLETQPTVEWDLLYLSYKDVEATRTYEVSQNPSIHLWRASQVSSPTAVVVNNAPRSIEKLNRCLTDHSDAVDRTICHCLKDQSIHAYLLEPRLSQSRPDFSGALNQSQTQSERDQLRHELGAHTKPAVFNVLWTNWVVRKLATS